MALSVHGHGRSGKPKDGDDAKGDQAHLPAGEGALGGAARRRDRALGHVRGSTLSEPEVVEPHVCTAHTTSEADGGKGDGEGWWSSCAKWDWMDP